ncbi:galactose-3-O-sulfotransferase 2-like [Lineus longissimus]|uniref:galactose-3-O-sulfotransferase 2-like n=1 Tax=Lineus longissimus TaxID=88925 RepID=UPI00315CEEBC
MVEAHGAASGPVVMKRPQFRFFAKLLLLMLTTLALLMVLGVLRSRSNDVHEWNSSSLYLPEAPEYANGQANLGTRLKGQQCFPAQDVYFLKVHKCASTTVASMFVRYAQKMDLTFGQTRTIGYSNSTGWLGWPDRFQPHHVIGTYVKGQTQNRKYQYEEFLEGQKINIVALHTIYDRDTVRRVMPDDTVSIAIIRKPFEQFQSIFDFSEFNLIKQANLTDSDPMSTFLESPEKYDIPLYGKKFIKNFMMTEFGYDNKDEEDSRRIRTFLKFIDRHFHLVMIAEHFYESIILMKRYLCWTTEDVVFLNLMVNHRKPHYVTSDDLVRYLYLEAMHRSWSRADYILYDYFNKTLWRRIQQETEDFQEEVNHLKYVTNEIAFFCNRPPDGTMLYFKTTRWGAQFNISAATCDYLNVSLYTGIYEALRDVPIEEREHHMPSMNSGVLVVSIVFSCLLLLAVVIAYVSKLCWPQKPRFRGKPVHYS